ncbi:hypothetical protein QRX60_40965 [Amycolatopsis mongoliensis]|uniref:Uncharacterized protein n=1 Tax=Amycolatopsis mongoliensis TaxID=715475 RepID=A0A9Y2JLR6_9PSEU|nr:hypothetical protein [Amycolatopsis sp. 4-36]WIY00368.1 hypothetical protein QRX60_40965 [Amycolatopsis sp. 4-36]
MIDPIFFSLDGQRYVNACCPEHLAALIDHARSSWSIAELWFGRLCRASKQPGMRDADMDQLRARARLSPDDLEAALAWNAGQTEPMLTLPGGQILPLSR